MNINANFKNLSANDIVEEEGDELYNNYRFKWHNNPKNKIVSAFPLFLDIEATSVCNLNCPHCLQSHIGFKKGFMQWEMYERIIDEAAANGCYGCKYNTLSRGEPLLHKDLPKMISYAKKKGLIDVYFNTNATLLTEGLSIKLLDSGLDRISFSIDGHDEKSYYENRRNDKFRQIEEEIIRFYIIRNSRRYSTKIRIQTVALDNIDLEKYKEKWIKYCDDIGVITYKEMRERKFGLVSDWACPQLWQRMSILYSGEILPCNHDDRQFAAIGNINNMTIGKAWRNIMYMREMHRKGEADLIDACDGCFLRTSEILRMEGE